MKHRDRHCFSRYNFPDDRLNFDTWSKRPGPGAQQYWKIHPMEGNLILSFKRGEREFRCNLSLAKLLQTEGSWRFFVAYGLRQIRALVRQTPNPVSR
jgi:hypothetical protein